MNDAQVQNVVVQVLVRNGSIRRGDLQIRNSADIADHPRPAEDRRRTEVGYFLAPCVCSSMCLPVAIASECSHRREHRLAGGGDRAR